ncbi:MAG: PBP1A family penicillin-binding protein [Rhodobacterales bacterium]|nr:PBP1A family penicillin-binding protein [Rhodobacterales bacterium]
MAPKTSRKKKPASTPKTRKTSDKPRKAPAKKTAGKAKAPRKRKASGKPSGVSMARKPKATWKRWFITEALVWGTGAALGLSIAGGVLWTKAVQDVEAYLANPPTTAPGVIYSAPMRVQIGQRASLASLAGDLLAAGYDRVDNVTEGGASGGAGQFSVQGQTLTVWTAPMTGPGFTVKGGLATLRLERSTVASTGTHGTVYLRPTVLGTIGDLESKRTDIDIQKISPWVEPALLAIEDARFRDHHGVDPIGIARALGRNLLSGGGMQGGSTLTQQLAKNLFLTPDRTLRRKVHEAFFAAALESKLSKDELIELYLGEVYLGQMGGLPLHGVEAAARAWFGVSAANLELHEAATIVGVIASPNRWSPVRHPEINLNRRNTVIERMVATGAIDEAKAERAKEQPLKLVGIEPSRVRRSPYAVDLAVDKAEEVLGEGALASGGYQVYTHIQPLLQRAAEEAVALGMAELDEDYPKAAGAQVGLVAVQVSDGAVVAMVGGRSYATSPFNRTTQAWRQAGSTVKPLTMLAVFDDGNLTPSDVLLDAPISRIIDGKQWTPRNYDGRYVGDISVRKAIEQSRNIPAILMAEQIGASRLQRFYRQAGLSKATNLPSASLGAFATTPLEMAGAYTAFANGGIAHEPVLVDAISTANGELVVDLDGKPIGLAAPQAAAQAIRVLEGVIDRGTGRRADEYGVSGQAGGKTGTTDDYRDAWFVGATPELAVAVWVGRDKGTLGLAGSRAALPTWSRFVAASGTTQGPWQQTEGLVSVDICDESGQVARQACVEQHEDLFVKGTVPRGECDLHGAPAVKSGGALSGLFKRRE